MARTAASLPRVQEWQASGQSSVDHHCELLVDPSRLSSQRSPRPAILLQQRQGRTRHRCHRSTRQMLIGNCTYSSEPTSSSRTASPSTCLFTNFSVIAFTKLSTFLARSFLVTMTKENLASISMSALTNADCSCHHHSSVLVLIIFVLPASPLPRVQERQTPCKRSIPDQQR